MNHIESLLLSLAEWLLKGAALLLLAALIVHVWRGSSAAQRHFLWLAAMVTLLLLPMTHLATPRWTLPVTRPAKVGVPQVTVSSALPTVTETVQTHVSPKSQGSAWPLPDWRTLLLATWLAGVAGLIGYRLLGSWRLRRLEKRSALVADTRVMELIRAVLDELRITREVTVRVSEECRVPVTWGIWRSVLLLPREALDWTDAQLTAALRHESGHIHRRDYLARWIAHLACALCWPNPLVWLAARSLRIAQEQATDDLVLRAGTPPEEYATQLFQAARIVATHGLFARHGVAMATPSTLENRVLAIVDNRRDRRPLSRASAVAGSGMVALALAVCTVAQMRGADPAPAAPGTAKLAAGPQVEIAAKFMELTGDAAKLDLGLTAETSIYTDPQFQVIIRALNQHKGVDLLSAPRVLTRSNLAALVQVGREFRYPTEWKKDAKGKWEPSTFDTKLVGVTLEVTPVIGVDGGVELRLKPSVVEFRGFTDLDGPKDAKALTTSDVPVGKDTLVAQGGKRLKPQFSERNLETTVKLKSGETVALDALKEQGDAKAFMKDPIPRRLVVFISARVITDSAPEDAKEAQVQGAAEKAAASIIIPKLEFREATVEEAVSFLRKKSRALSPDGSEVNIVLKRPKGGDEARITVALTNIPLIEALRYVAQLGNLNLHVQPDALVLGDLEAVEAPRSAAEPPPAAPSAAMAKANGIIIPKLEFNEASPQDAVEFLRIRSRELDPEKKGVNLVLDLPPGSDWRITLSLSNIPLSEALKYVAGLSNLEVVGEAQAIVLRQSRVPTAVSHLAIKGLDEVPRAAIPVAKPVPGKPGFVTSPYDKSKGEIDVRGFPAGTEVSDPYVGKPFLVPDLPKPPALDGN